MAADIPAMLEVFFEADEHLRAQDGRPQRPRDPEHISPYLEHLLGTDAATSFLAHDRGRIIAFGIVMVRDGSGFLSELFVAPREQGRGLGRAIVAACLAGGSVQRMATCADAVQPVSTGLYASLGLAPRVPIYVLSGTLDAARLPSQGTDVEARELDADGAEVLDDEVVGYRRAPDHETWSRLGRIGWCFVGASGNPAGYGYTHPSGRVGPVLARDPNDLHDLVARLIRITPRYDSYRCLVAGHAIRVLQMLLAAGMRIDGPPSIYCADHGGPDFARYLPMSSALL